MLPVLAGGAVTVVVIVVILLLLTGGDPELSALETALATNTEASLEQFLHTYPESAEAPRVSALLEDLLFATARTAGDPKAYRTSLERFPSGKHADEARAALDAIRYRELSQRAAETGDPKPLGTYLREYPDGRHAAAAQASIVDLSFARAKSAAEEGGSERPLLEYLREFPKSVHDKDALALVEDIWFRRLVADDEAGVEDIRAYLVRFPSGAHREEAEKLLATAEKLAAQAEFRREHETTLLAIERFSPSDLRSKVTQLLQPKYHPDGPLLKACLAHEIVRLTKPDDPELGKAIELLDSTLKLLGRLALTQSDLPRVVRIAVNRSRVECGRYLAKLAAEIQLDLVRAIEYWEEADVIERKLSPN